MSSLGHRLAFGWGFCFGVLSCLIAATANGFQVKLVALIFLVIATFGFMVGAWFRCAEEKRVLDKDDKKSP